MRTLDRRGELDELGEDEEDGLRPRPAPGKVTRTSRLPGRRGSISGEREDEAARGLSYLSTPGGRRDASPVEHDDPFALHFVEKRAQDQLDIFTDQLGGLARGAVRADESARAETEARGARGLARPGLVALHPEVDPTSTEGKKVLAHEAVHLVQFTLPAHGAIDIRAAEAEAESIAVELINSGRTRRPRMPLPATHIAADEDAPPGGEAEAAPTYTLPKGVPFEVRGNVMIYRRAWFENRGEFSSSDLELISPTAEMTHAPRRMKVVLEAYRKEGNFSWATPEMIEHAAENLYFHGPYDDDPEITDWRFRDDVYAILGPPPESDIFWLRQGDGMLLVIRTSLVEEKGTRSPRKGKDDLVIKGPLMRRVLDALAATVGLPFDSSVDPYTYSVKFRDGNAQAGYKWRLPREELEYLFGAELWAQYLETGEGVLPTVAGQPIVDSIPAEDMAVVQEFMEAIGAHEVKKPDEKTSYLSPYVATVIRKINELRDTDPDLHARVIEELRMHVGADNADKITGRALEQAVEEAKLNRAYEETGVAKPFVFDPDGTRSRNPMVDEPIRGAIENLSGLTTSAEEGIFRFRRDNPQDPFVEARIQIKWLTQSIDTPVSKDDGTIERGKTADGTTYHGPKTISDVEFRVDPYKVRLKPGWYRVHAFVDHNLFRSAHFQTDVFVATEAQRQAELREEAIGEAKIDEPKSYNFATETGWLDGAPIVGDSDNYLGNTFGGELPEGWAGKTLEERIGFLRSDVAKMERLIEEYGKRTDEQSKEVVGYAKTALEKAKGNISQLQGEDSKGWTFFELRGSYVSRQSGIDDAVLKLIANARRDKADQNTTVQIHDYSRVYEPKDYKFSNERSTFDAAFRATFVEMTKTYPAGRVSLLAEELDDKMQSTGRTVGYDLDTNSGWRTLKETVWSEKVQTLVALASIALTVLVPVTTPFVLAITTAYQTADNIDNLLDKRSKGIANDWDYATTIGQIALDLLPYVGRAKVLVKNARTTMYVIDGLQIGGELVFMTYEGLRMVEDLRDNDIRELAEMQARLDANPADAALKIEIERKIKKLQGRFEETFIQMAESGALQMATHAAFNAALRDAMDTRMGDLKATGAFHDDPDVKKPYYDAKSGRIVANSKTMSLAEVERLKRAYDTDMESRKKDVAETLDVDLDKVRFVAGDQVKAEVDADGNWTITTKVGATREDLVEAAWNKKPNKKDKDRPPLIRDGMRPVYEPDIIAGGHNVPVGNRVEDPGDALKIVRKLTGGDTSGFDELGVKVADDFDARAFEWGVGELPNGDGFIVVKGAHGHIDWDHFPGVRGIAHSHPSRNLPVGELSLRQLLRGGGGVNNVEIARVRVLPSDADFGYVSQNGIKGHVVLTPYVYHDGKIVEASAKRSKPRLEFVIEHAEYVGDSLADRKPVFKATVTLRAGGKEIDTVEMWSTYHSKHGDMVSTHPIDLSEDIIDLDLGKPTGNPRSASEAARPKRQPDYDGADEVKREAVRDWNAMHDTPEDGYQGGMSFDEFLAEYRAGKKFGRKHGDKSSTRRWHKEGSSEPEYQFEKGIDAKDVLAHLTKSGKSFGPYFKMLKKLKLTTRAKLLAIIEKMEVGGLLEDTVRGRLKDMFRDKVVQKIASTPTKQLKKKYKHLFRDKSLSKEEALAAARHGELMEATQRLNSSDKGNLAEAWYERVHAQEGAQRHVAVDADDMEARHGIDPDDLGTDRVIDVLEGNTATEIKTVNGALGKEQRDQFDAYVALVKKKPPVTVIDNDGKEVELRQLKYVFTTAKGAKENLEFMRDGFDALPPPKLVFEVFDARGVKHTIHNAGELDMIESW